MNIHELFVGGEGEEGETEHEQREKEIEIGQFWETNCLFYSGVFLPPLFLLVSYDGDG